MAIAENLKNLSGPKSASIELPAAAAGIAMLVLILAPSIGKATRPGQGDGADEINPPEKSAFEIKTLMIGKRRYCYKDEGKGNAVVFVRAAYIPENQYDGQLFGLAKAGYRVIVPYRAGSGPSDGERVMTIAKDADDVFALLDHLGVKRFVIGGHCGSVRVVRQIYLCRPERIAGVISIEAGAFGGRCKPDSGSAAKERLDKETRALFEKNEKALAPLKRLWDYPSDYNTALLRRWATTRRERRGKEGRQEDPRTLKAPSGRFCKVPLLVIAAGRGRVRANDPEAIRAGNSLLAADATFVLITNAGHWVFAERPEATNEAILEFLAGHVDSDPKRPAYLRR